MPLDVAATWTQCDCGGIERLERLVALGIEHFHTLGVIFDTEAEEATRHRFVSEVMPAVREAALALGYALISIPK